MIILTRFENSKHKRSKPMFQSPNRKQMPKVTSVEPFSISNCLSSSPNQRIPTTSSHTSHTITSPYPFPLLPIPKPPNFSLDYALLPGHWSVGEMFPAANDTRKVLIESCTNDDDNTNLEDDCTDESHFFFMFNTILSGTARLNILLPTATILAFSIFAPLLTNDGKCDTLNRWLMGVFLVISSASCVFFVFTDSFRTASGRLYYGIATASGIWTFNGGRKRPSRPADYKLRWDDFFHASLSLIAFLTFAALNNDVVRCYYPAMPRKVTNVVPLLVGFVISVLFVVFPSKRRGIGYPFLLRRDALYLRT